ncbi:hypothetical protein [Paraburkholderia kirstenboschensis]|uniref:hypothetical protein n=1 Tax=Paraburkholderia kirstenboschensis TaxID=1245436 RepID=UPI0013E3CBE5|nr:hypothetical protein [Paraburkholderia kirstenboschensis]
MEATHRHLCDRCDHWAPGIAAVAVLIAFFAAVPRFRQAAYLANVPGALPRFGKEQIALRSEREPPGTAYASLSGKAAVAAVRVLPVAGNGRDDAGLPIHLAYAEVEGIADRQVARTVERDMCGEVQKRVGRRNAISVVTRRAARLRRTAARAGYFGDSAGPCVKSDDFWRNGIDHVQVAVRVEGHGHDVGVAQVDDGRDNSCPMVHAPDAADRRIGNVKIAFPVHGDIVCIHRCLRGRATVTAVGHVGSARASNRGNDAGVPIDPSHYMGERFGNEYVTCPVERNPCRIVEHGLRRRAAVAAIACLPGAGNDSHRSGFAIDAPNNAICRFGGIYVSPSVRRDGFGLDSGRAYAAETGAGESADDLRCGGLHYRDQR